MPNHIKNVVFFYGDMEEIKRMRKEISSPGREGESDYVLDFNKLIPMPPELDVVAGSSSNVSFAAWWLLNNMPEFPDHLFRYWMAIDEGKMRLKEKYKEEKKLKKSPNVKSKRFLKFIKECNDTKKYEVDLKLGEEIYNNIIKFQFANWYDWRIQHWGTKWNCYECEDEGPRRIAFLTAWAPPDPVFDELSRRYPQIEFTCYSVDEGDSETVWERKYEKGELSEQYTFRDAELVQRIWDASGNEFVYKEEK